MKHKPYTPARYTDIAKTWRIKYAYVPASELPEIKIKHAYFKALGVQK